MKIKLEKSIYVVDNYSTDGTYETLQDNLKKYNMIVSQARCTRGRGRQLAIEMAEKKASANDMFMFIDLDTVYR
jgi:glycosyltransferase involved in cell wall biosynthesis